MLAPMIHIALLAVSALTTAVLAGYSGLHRDSHSVLSFGGLMVGFTLYSVAHLIGLLVIHPRWRLVWESLQWTGAAIIPLFWVLFAIEYTGYEDMLTPRTIGILSIIPVLTVMFSWTNGWHGWMWTQNTVVLVEGLAILEQQFGPWTLVFIIFSYGMFSVGGFLIIRLIWVSDHFYASQAGLLLVGLAIPLLANGLTVLGLTVIQNPALDLTPYAFLVTGVAYSYALFRDRLFSVVPATHQLGRDAAIRDLDDGVIIVDPNRTIIYCNPAAGDLLDVAPENVLGCPVRSLVDDSTLDFDADGGFAEIQTADRIYEFRVSPIRGSRDRLIGHTVLVRDITARKRREERVIRQRDELVRLDRLNAVVRGVNRALLSATSRQEIEREVCDRLAAPALYRAVCVADIPTWNGDAERWTVASADSSTGLDEVPSGVTVSHDDATEPTVETAGDAPKTWTLVPLTYGRTVYSVLGLQTATDTEREEVTLTREREVLAELGQLIGQAIQAVETRQLLSADSIVELELHCTDEGEPLVDAAGSADALAVVGFIPNAGKGHVAYISVDGGPVTAVAETLAGPDGDARVIRGDEDTDEGLIEWRVPAATPLGTLAEHGANLLETTVDDGTARYVAEVASEADIRPVVDRIQEHAPDTWLEAVRQRDHPTDQADSVSGQTIEDLTDRQQEALEAAYRAGYYDWPRESTAEEIAETLDISAPTLHAHLRKAEDSVLADLFDRDAGHPRDG